MSTFTTSMDTINALEILAEKNTIIHRLHPTVKIIMTLIYIIMVVSYPPYAISGVVSFCVYPVIMMAMGEIPYKPLLKRLLIALPFSFFAGISNIIFNQRVAFMIGNLPMTLGMISFISMMIKTILTVMSVLILIATTSMPRIAYGLLKLKIPKLFVIQIMLIYRYIFVLLEQVLNMYTAYRLRSSDKKGIKMKDMGIFMGQLLLKSFSRADAIYEAMKCRGYDGEYHFSNLKNLYGIDFVFLLISCGMMILLRFFDLGNFIGSLF